MPQWCKIATQNAFNPDLSGGKRQNKGPTPLKVLSVNYINQYIRHIKKNWIKHSSQKVYFISYFNHWKVMFLTLSVNIESVDNY